MLGRQSDVFRREYPGPPFWTPPILTVPNDNQTGVYYTYTPRPVRGEDLRIMRRIDELHLEHPFYGARRLAQQLEREGFDVGRVHVTALMRRMGIEALYPRPRTSILARDAKIYPYLLDGLTIERPNQVWSSDLTYLPMAHGFL